MLLYLFGLSNFICRSTIFYYLKSNAFGTSFYFANLDLGADYALGGIDASTKTGYALSIDLPIFGWLLPNGL